MAEPALPGKLKNTSGPDLENKKNVKKAKKSYFVRIP
jgi:hypothetical protein